MVFSDAFAIVASDVRGAGMCKILEGKWRIAAGVGFAVALTTDWVAKHFAGTAMMSRAKQIAGQADPQLQSFVRLSETTRNIGVVVAFLAVLCWVASAHRHEPGTSALVVLLAALYGLSFLLVV